MKALLGHFPSAFLFFPVAFFCGLPIFNTPAATSQLGCLHFEQRAGLPAIRLTQLWPHRRHSQIISFGIGIANYSHGSILFS